MDRLLTRILVVAVCVLGAVPFARAAEGPGGAGPTATNPLRYQVNYLRVSDRSLGASQAAQRAGASPVPPASSFRGTSRARPSRGGGMQVTRRANIAARATGAMARVPLAIAPAGISRVVMPLADTAHDQVVGAGTHGAARRRPSQRG